MSVNQSRGDKNEPPQYRRSGRSGNPVSQRNLPGGGGGKGGGAGGPPSSSSFYSSRSFKKVVSNVQGAQPRVSSRNENANVNSDSLNSSTACRLQNGAPIPQMGPGMPDAPSTAPTVKSTDVSSQKSTPGLPKAPQANAVTPSSGTSGPATPAKGSADASRAFPLQFGSISPGVVNGMQIPARTNSAPPNFDEQKQAQAFIDSLKAASHSTPAVPKQQLSRKDDGAVGQSNATHPIQKDKKDMPALTQTQRPSGHPIPPMPGVSMQMPFHQSPLHLQFGGPNPQMQSQGMANSSLPMPLPMPLPMGNTPQVQQPVFVPGIPHHPLQSQGIIRQGQGMNFSSQMGPPQLPSQLGNMGMGLGTQYQQQQTGTFGSPRRAVKITHPDTHEELRLDKRTDGYGDGGSKVPRSQPHGLPHAQVVPSFPPAHPVNYYSNSYNGSAPFFPPASSSPLTSAQITHGSQPPRFHNKVTVKPASSPQGEKVVNSSVSGSSPANDKCDLSKTQRASVQIDSETVAGSTSQKPNSNTIPVTNKPSAAAFRSFQSENLTAHSLSYASPASVDNAGSFIEEDKKQGNKAQSTPVDQVGGQSSSILSSSLGRQDSMDSGAPEAQKSSASSSGTNEDELEISKNVAPTTVTANPTSKCDGGKKGHKSVDSEITSDSSLKIEGSKAEIVGSKERGEDEVTKEVTPAMEAVDQTKDGALPDEKTGCNETLSVETARVQQEESVDNRVPSSEAEGAVSNSRNLMSSSSSGSLDKILLETSKAKGSTSKGKKKRRELLKNADAQGTTSDLYMAYKGPDEKKEILSTETVESFSDNIQKQASVGSSGKNVTSDEKYGPDDWEDAADISTPRLETPDDRKQDRGGYSEDGNDGTTKKYSRDFLLKLSEHSTDLPEGFEITSDIAEALIVSNNRAYRDYPSPGRAVDRSAVGPRLDRRPSNVGDDEKWSKVAGPIGFPGNVAGFRPVHGANYGVLRNPRGQAPMGGVFAGQMQSPGPQRYSSDSDRWQRATGYQKGLIPTPMQVMHKAEKKYEVGKVTDEEQAKQRQLKGILNKLTPQNFEKLFEQVKQVNIDNAGTLSGVIGQIFDKALMEPTFCEMYANFCSRLSVELPDFSENDEKITFKRLLLNKCQEEFERGEREQEEANRTEEEGEVKQSEGEREEKRVKAGRRMLGNIRLIGELYNKRMLMERIMHDCIKKLLGQQQNPDEEDIESLCKLMSTIGEMIDHPKAKVHMDAYLDIMYKLSNNMKLSSRVRFMLKDVIDLRKNKWQQRRKVEGPKKIEEVHRDAAQERQAQSGRLGRGPSVNMSLRRGQPMDFGPRGSNVLPSPNAQMGGFRGLPQQLRGHGNQDTFESRTLSVPLRPMGDDSITLGPQGGLAKGMSIKGYPLMQGTPLPVVGHNGYGSMSKRVAHGPRFAPPHTYDQPNIQERDSDSVNRDMRNAGRNFDRVPPSSAASRGRPPTPPKSLSSEKVLSEDRLHDMSMEAIKEFYSARDEKEVALCIKDLNTPSFYPSMISIWVTDSFERKDLERDLLTKLLINLTKSHGILNQDSLVRGFESVLSTLEDAVNDAPRAAEFLGRILARILIEDVIPYQEAWSLIHEGSEDQGRLVEIGLAAEVLGAVLETVKSDKGESFLNEISTGSNLHAERFRPSNAKKSLRLDNFM